MSHIRRKFEEARDRAAALRAKSDRTEAEEQELNDQLDRAEQLKSELDAEKERDARLDALAEVSRSIAIPGQLVQFAGEPEQLTAGEYFAEVAKLINGGSEEEFLDRAAAYHDRATGVSTDVAGILPVPIVGPLIDYYDPMRKVFASFSARPMPAGGKTFERPKVVQHVLVGTQDAEADPLDSQKFTVDSDTVTKATIGGTLEVSRQMQDWTTPEALGLVVQDFVKVYARYTETLAVAHLEALATDVSPYEDTDTEAIVESFINGVLAVYDNLDNDDMPLTLWIDTASAAALATPTGATDRTTWAVVREALASIDSDMSVVVSRRLTAGTRIIGVGSMVESYEQRHGLLSMVKPTNLTTDISYSGYVAFHGIEDGFVALEEGS
jgi:hypothetical protein